MKSEGMEPNRSGEMSEMKGQAKTEQHPHPEHPPHPPKPPKPGPVDPPKPPHPRPVG